MGDTKKNVARVDTIGFLLILLVLIAVGIYCFLDISTVDNLTKNLIGFLLILLVLIAGGIYCFLDTSTPKSEEEDDFYKSKCKKCNPHKTNKITEGKRKGGNGSVKNKKGDCCI